MAVDEVRSAERIRIGSCKQCGECCRRLGWLSVYATEDTLEWLQARDPDIRVVPNEDMEDYYWVSFPYTCKQLVQMEDGRFHCRMHDGKPSVCKQYPEPWDDLKPGCGFRFAD